MMVNGMCLLQTPHTRFTKGLANSFWNAYPYRGMDVGTCSPPGPAS